MVVVLITLIILSLIMGTSKGFMDASSENIFGGKHHKFNKSQSWKLKWELNSVEIPIKATKTDNWWYFGIMKPYFKEKFPFSSTILVSVTDFWHLMQFIHYKAILGIIYIIAHYDIPYYKIIVVYILFLVTFEYIHNKLKSS